MSDAAIRAARAQQLLDDDLFQEAFAAVEADAVNALAAARLADLATLQWQTALLQATRQVRGHIENMARSGRTEQPRQGIA